MKISIVVLCYRSEDKIIPFINDLKIQLNKNNIEYELVLVANYFLNSNDKTPKIVKNLAKDDDKIIAITLQKKGMMGWDAISGLKKCTGHAIALIDGDGQMPAKDIIRIYKIFMSGEFDFVKTFRIKRGDGLFRSIQSKIFNIFFRILFPNSLYKDINSKPKIISRDAFDKMSLSCPGWFIDGEIMLEVRRLRLSYAEIPTSFEDLNWRVSFVKFSSILEMVSSLLYYRFIYFFKK